jgi:hypothetical protein
MKEIRLYVLSVENYYLSGISILPNRMLITKLEQIGKLLIELY